MKIPNFHTLLFCLCCCCISAACSSSNEEPSAQKLAIVPQKPIGLNISLNMIQLESKLGMPVTLRVLMTNNQTEAIRFCKLNSPANEQVWTDCFRIKDSKGKLIPYIGTNPKYSGPIKEEHMITLEAGGMGIYTIDVHTLYQLDQAGRYSIVFVGDQLNLLPASLPASFILK